MYAVLCYIYVYSSAQCCICTGLLHIYTIHKIAFAYIFLIILLNILPCALCMSWYVWYPIAFHFGEGLRFPGSTVSRPKAAAGLWFVSAILVNRSQCVSLTSALREDTSYK